jgi:hypothetical protein
MRGDEMKPLDEMTPEEIRQEIAERRGWSYVVVSHKYTALPDGKLSEGIPIYGYIFNGGVSYPPDWPASIAAAWELVEEISKGDYTTSLTYSDCADVVIYDQGNGDPEADPSLIYVSSGHADTAPLAICKAWLAWKRSEDK